MATRKPFKASRKREVKKEPTYKVGSVMIPSYPDELAYKKEIYSLVLKAVLPASAINVGYAEDRLTLSSLAILRARAFAAAETFVNKVNGHSRRVSWSVIEELGKELTVGEAVLSPTIDKQIEFNIGLITDLAKESQEKLTKLYQKHGVDQHAVYSELKEYVGNRAKLIANDQNAKVFTSLNTERMLDSGIATFIWDHSSAGKQPRECHVLRNGHEFSLKGSPAELYFPDGTDANSSFKAKKGDEGKPGWAINCRCRMRPTVSLDD